MALVETVIYLSPGHSVISYLDNLCTKSKAICEILSFNYHTLG